MNQAYAQYNGGLQAAYNNGLITQEEKEKRTIHFEAGQNAVVMTDEYLTDLTSLGLPSIRQTKPEDLIVLPAASVIGQPAPNNSNLLMGVSAPLVDRWILSDNEFRKCVTDSR